MAFEHGSPIRDHVTVGWGSAMLFGDAKASLSKLVTEVKAA